MVDELVYEPDYKWELKYVNGELRYVPSFEYVPVVVPKPLFEIVEEDDSGVWVYESRPERVNGEWKYNFHTTHQYDTWVTMLADENPDIRGLAYRETNHHESAAVQLARRFYEAGHYVGDPHAMEEAVAAVVGS